MRRVLPWLGLILLAISFVWFVRSPSRPQPAEVAKKTAPARRPPPLVVVLDPGHGGQDSGAICGTVLEKDLTLDVALRAELLLRATHNTAVLTRTDDRYLSLAERAAIGNRSDNSLFISIHFNDDNRTAASGVETYYAQSQSTSRFGFFSWLPFLRVSENTRLTARSESLARFIQAALVERTRALDRGAKAQQFFVIANVRHPAALVEGGFLTNKSDVTKLETTEYRQQIAAAISAGVERFKSATKTGEAGLTLVSTGSE